MVKDLLVIIMIFKATEQRLFPFVSSYLAPEISEDHVKIVTDIIVLPRPVVWPLKQT